MGLMHREGWITFEDGGCLEFSVESFRFPLFQSFFLIHFGIKIQIPLMHYRKKNALFACTLSSKIRDTFPGDIIDSFLKILFQESFERIQNFPRNNDRIIIFYTRDKHQLLFLKRILPRTMEN